MSARLCFLLCSTQRQVSRASQWLDAPAAGAAAFATATNPTWQEWPGYDAPADAAVPAWHGRRWHEAPVVAAAPAAAMAAPAAKAAPPAAMAVPAAADAAAAPAFRPRAASAYQRPPRAHSRADRHREREPEQTPIPGSTHRRLTVAETNPCNRSVFHV